MRNCRIILLPVVVAVLATASMEAQFSGKVAFVSGGSVSAAITGPNGVPANPLDQPLVDTLRAWGVAVSVYIAASGTGGFNNATAPVPPDSVLDTYNLIFFSEVTSSSGAFRVRGPSAAGPYNTVNVPVVSLDNWFIRNAAVGFISGNANSSTTYDNILTDGNVTIVDATGHALAAGFSSGQTVTLTTSTTGTEYLNFAVIPPTSGQEIIPIAAVSGTTDQLIAWGAEAGTALHDNQGNLRPDVTLKKRYAAVGIHANGYGGMTSDAWKFIKAAITWVLAGAGPTGVEEAATVPKDFSLNQNFPNPFNPSTKISFNLSKAGYTTLSVFNVLGEKVATIVNQELSAGYHEFPFVAPALTSGVYFYRLESDQSTDMKKMMLVK